MQNGDRGDSILKEEFEKALRDMKANKAPGVDLIAAEILQNLGQAEKIILFKLLCDMYGTGDLLNDYKVSKTVTIPKKEGVDKCDNYRVISLMTHASEILIPIIYRR